MLAKGSVSTLATYTATRSLHIQCFDGRYTKIKKKKKIERKPSFGRTSLVSSKLVRASEKAVLKFGAHGLNKESFVAVIELRFRRT